MYAMLVVPIRFGRMHHSAGRLHSNKSYLDIRRVRHVIFVFRTVVIGTSSREPKNARVSNNNANERTSIVTRIVGYHRSNYLAQWIIKSQRNINNKLIESKRWQPTTNDMNRRQKWRIRLHVVTLGARSRLIVNCIHVCGVVYVIIFENNRVAKPKTEMYSNTAQPPSFIDCMSMWTVNASDFCLSRV